MSICRQWFHCYFNANGIIQFLWLWNFIKNIIEKQNNQNDYYIIVWHNKNKANWKNQWKIIVHTNNYFLSYIIITMKYVASCPDNIKKENWHHLNKSSFCYIFNTVFTQNSFIFITTFRNISLRGMSVFPRYVLWEIRMHWKAAVVLYGNFQIQSFIFFLFGVLQAFEWLPS